MVEVLLYEVKIQSGTVDYIIEYFLWEYFIKSSTEYKAFRTLTRARI